MSDFDGPDASQQAIGVIEAELSRLRLLAHLCGEIVATLQVNRRDNVRAFDGMLHKEAFMKIIDGWNVKYRDLTAGTTPDGTQGGDA